MNCAVLAHGIFARSARYLRPKILRITRTFMYCFVCCAVVMADNDNTRMRKNPRL